MDEWSRKINSIMDEMLNRHFFEFRDCGEWQPDANVYESAAAWFVCVDLAGVGEDRIEVHCTDERHLIIVGQRGQPVPPGDEGKLSMQAMEIREGRFRRELELPKEIDIEAVEATYSKGYLWIRLPKLTARSKNPKATTRPRNPQG